MPNGDQGTTSGREAPPGANMEGTPLTLDTVQLLPLIFSLAVLWVLRNLRSRKWIVSAHLTVPFTTTTEAKPGDCVTALGLDAAEYIQFYIPQLAAASGGSAQSPGVVHCGGVSSAPVHAQTNREAD